MLKQDLFWHYACQLYTNKQVEEVLLHFQNAHGKNVNVCLLLDYITDLNQQLSQADVDALIQCATQLDEQLLSPYRIIRHTLKNEHSASPNYSAARSSLLKAELELEKLQQHYLIEQVNTCSISYNTSANNLALYLPESLVQRFLRAKS
ncbi:TIGR02444 family protein [Pseudoalteromonas luteoviolacea]|uniref:TIGR02444 family protein n=1 Tax=Pseudoalteromonas luteoviolacea TaxID=43657 RepID=UPI001B35A2DB|nr:TIGR02444 family protein [Pseudoalteromonas luteoviolacea]MBQ4814173.1 TIGR02444 family protein [Pseudoalteromonas luteoviolacea]